MLVIVMAALYIGVIVEVACQECRYCRVAVAADAAVQTDARLCQCHLCTAADAAADQHICADGRKQAHQCAVSLTVCVHDSLGYDLAVFHFIHLKLLGVSEMLEDLLIFIGNCNFHYFSP